MKERIASIEELITRIRPTTRREFIKRSVAMGAAVPAVGTLLAACGGDDDDDDDDDGDEAAADPTATRERSVPTTSVGGSTEEPEEDEEEDDEEEPTATEAEEEDEPTPTEAAEEGGPQEGGVFVAMGHHEVASLSPDDDGPSVHFFIIGNIHAPLLELDPWFTLQPNMAESFEASDDGMQFTFNIRQGVTWHDGNPFTASDAAYTWNFYRSPDNATASTSDFDGVAEVEATDDTTVVVTMERPNAALLARGGQFNLVQEAHHSAIGEDAYKADPIGTGPWQLVEWRAAEFTELERFEDYWEGAPYMDGIRENIVPEASVRAIALENQEADSAVWPLLTDDHLRFMEDPEFADYTVNITSSVAVNHFMLNHTNPIHQDKAVRQALMYGLDREAIRDDLWQGLAVLATANISPALAFYYNPDVQEYPYDPDMANQLLDDAGWVIGGDGVREKDGLRLEWTCTVITGDQARKPEAELAQANWSEIGIKVEIAEAPLASIQEGQRAGEIDMTLYNWTYGGGSGDPDGSNTLKSGERNNWSNWSNERVDELLDQGLIETDPEARKPIYDEVQAIVAEEVPFLFVKYWDWFNIFTPRVKGIAEDPLTGDAQYQQLHKAWIEE